MPNIHVQPGGLKVTRNSQNEGMPPPTISASRERLCQFVEGRKRITNDPYVLSIIAKGYRLLFTIGLFCLRPPGKYDFPRAHRRFRNARANIPNASKERNHRDTLDTPGFYSRVNCTNLVPIP